MNAEKEKALDQETEEELRDNPKQLPEPTPSSPHYAFNLPHHHHQTGSSLFKEENVGKLHVHPEWSHPERLSDKERENLVSQVPKDTIELLKEGHSEYFIK